MPSGISGGRVDPDARADDAAQWRELLGAYQDWNPEIVRLIIEGPTAACPRGESGGDENVISPDGQNIGLGQVNIIHSWRVGGDLDALRDPATNIRVMHDIWLDAGGSYSPWSCAP